MAYDQKNYEEQVKIISEKIELITIRKSKKLHEKAEHLLGRSYRNCVMHSQSGKNSQRASHRNSQRDSLRQMSSSRI